MTVQYHDTVVFRKDASGAVTLNTGGWQTVTTKNRINMALQVFGIGHGIYQHKGKWYIQAKNPTYTRANGEPYWLEPVEYGSTGGGCGQVHVILPLGSYRFFRDAVSPGNVLAIDWNIYTKHGRTEGLVGTYSWPNSTVCWCSVGEDMLRDELTEEEAREIHPEMFEHIERIGLR